MGLKKGSTKQEAKSRVFGYLDRLLVVFNEMNLASERISNVKSHEAETLLQRCKELERELDQLTEEGEKLHGELPKRTFIALSTEWERKNRSAKPSNVHEIKRPSDVKDHLRRTNRSRPSCA